MGWLVTAPWFWPLAIMCSLFWGVYGINIHKEVGECRCITNIGVFLSEFLGSMGGWISLFVLNFRVENYGKELGIFDATLLIVAVVGIFGFSYRIVDAFGKGDGKG